jgi:hypothetical protein
MLGLVVSWVTRLGEFSPNGWLFTLGQIFLKMAEVAHIFGVLFYTVWAMHLSWQERIGPHFGRFFFTNSSGHPASEATFANPSSWIIYLNLAVYSTGKTGLTSLQIEKRWKFCDSFMQKFDLSRVCPGERPNSEMASRFFRCPEPRTQSYDFDLQRQRCKFLQRHG